MPGTVIGGIRASKKNKQKKYITNRKTGELIEIPEGMTMYDVIGAMGGRASEGGGFAANRELAKRAGRLGGLKSRRRKEA